MLRFFCQVCFARTRFYWPCLFSPDKSRSIGRLGFFVTRRRGHFFFFGVCCRDKGTCDNDTRFIVLLVVVLEKIFGGSPSPPTNTASYPPVRILGAAITARGWGGGWAGSSTPRYEKARASPEPFTLQHGSAQRITQDPIQRAPVIIGHLYLFRRTPRYCCLLCPPVFCACLTPMLCLFVCFISTSVCFFPTSPLSPHLYLSPFRS